MKKILLTFAFITLTIIFKLPTSAQISGADVKVYDKNGLSFSYPSIWELTDQSTADLQQVKLNLPESSALIYITSPRNSISTSEQLEAAREGITDRFVENITQKFTLSPSSILRPETDCFEVNGKAHIGRVIRGTYQKQLSVADIIPTFLEHRFVNLVFIRSNSEYDKSNPAWQMITKTVKNITPGADKPPVPTLDVIVPASTDIINGKAVSLPKPSYPSMASPKRLRGSVSVQVTIDEKGKIIQARAVSGAIEFVNVAVQAAKESRFTPTYVCQQPVKVTGMIIYNFVP